MRLCVEEGCLWVWLFSVRHHLHLCVDVSVCAVLWTRVVKATASSLSTPPTVGRRRSVESLHPARILSSLVMTYEVVGGVSGGWVGRGGASSVDKGLCRVGAGTETTRSFHMIQALEWRREEGVRGEG